MRAASKRYYQLVFSIIALLVAHEVKIEAKSNIGRADIIMITNSYIFVVELKIDQPAQVALEQIKEKRYYEPYLNSGKHIILVGISFDTVTLRNVSEWVTEPLAYNAGIQK
jgi:Holliday junction resolvase-like predicted endonuclease